MTLHLELPGPPTAPGPVRPPSRRAALTTRIPLAAANLAAVTFFLLSWSRHGVAFGPYQIDLDVYRIGGQAWLRGTDLYGVLPATSNGLRLPFSYPPIAAVVLSPLSLLSMTAASTALTLVSVGLAAMVLRMFLRRAVAGRAGSSWTVAWLLPLALFLEPVRNTLLYGQVNLVLMALVAADCLAVAPRWPRGALVGVAAAIKLTPAAFVLFFLVRRDYRAALTMTVSFGVSTAAGFVLAWGDSVRYWTSVVFQSGRPGNPGYAANQSIEGALARAGVNPHSPAGVAAWLALSAIVVALAYRGMRAKAVNAGAADAWALSLNALAALLVSPISWSHHWVWGETAILTLALSSWQERRRGGLALAGWGLACFAATPQWWLPSGGNRELHWAGWEQALGSSYVAWALAVLATSASSCAGWVTGHRVSAETSPVLGDGVFSDGGGWRRAVSRPRGWPRRVWR
jgi:alpha-1,2-mannosyltransferase